jgi:hypothetical protein
MARKIILVIAAATLALIGGCIVSDQLVTITIQPDGSADWVRFQSNIRSTEKGAKGAQELKQFLEEFDAHKDADYQRILKAGGEVKESRWLRREEPYANILVARLPTASALQEFYSIRGEKGEVVTQPCFTQSGNRRRLSIEIPVPKEGKSGETAKPTVEGMRQDQANGISETRFVVTGGQIVGSRGFIVAADKRSALIDPFKVQELLRAAVEKVEIFIEWELTENRADAL